MLSMRQLPRWLAGSLLLAQIFSPVAAQSELTLPTPLEAFEHYDPQAEALLIFGELLEELPEARREQVSQLALAAQIGALPPESVDVVALLRELHWKKQKGRILRLLVYQSGALRVVEGQSPNWTRFVHDFLLFFLNELPDDRLLERISTQLRLARSEAGGNRLLALIDRTPTLQKLGQILARYPGVPDEVRSQLQLLENSISTSRRDDIVDFIRSEIGPEVEQRHALKFDDELLAEATIGAVIGVSLRVDSSSPERRAVCKVIKPYAVAALTEELALLDKLVLYFEKNASYYDLGQVPLSSMFEDLKTALEKEARVAEEQGNLRAAWEYYRDDPRVVVPAVLPPSTESVTFMDFVDGGKIVDAFPNDPAARSGIARRLDQIMTVEVIFSRHETALFHGDPHAGNVFYLAAPDGDPYRIALLDWGLRGELSRPQRQQLIQLLLGVNLKNEKRVRHHAAVLLEGGLPADPAEALRIRDTAVAVMQRAAGKDTFVVLAELVTDLTTLGYRLDFDVVLFIKAQVTILGILRDLDPELDRKKIMASHIRGLMFRETPKRLLNTVYFPGWTAHNYSSMLSNEDMRDAGFQSMGRGFKKFGGWIWSGLSWPFRGSADPQDASSRPHAGLQQ